MKAETPVKEISVKRSSFYAIIIGILLFAVIGLLYFSMVLFSLWIDSAVERDVYRDIAMEECQRSNQLIFDLNDYQFENLAMVRLIPLPMVCDVDGEMNARLNENE